MLFVQPFPEYFQNRWGLLVPIRVSLLRCMAVLAAIALNSKELVTVMDSLNRRFRQIILFSGRNCLSHIGVAADYKDIFHSGDIT